MFIVGSVVDFWHSFVVVLLSLGLGPLKSPSAL